MRSPVNRHRLWQVAVDAVLIAAAWLLLIAVNLVLTGRFFDVAVRDVAMAIAAFALARLTEAHAAAALANTRIVASRDRRAEQAA